MDATMVKRVNNDSSIPRRRQQQQPTTPIIYVWVNTYHLAILVDRIVLEEFEAMNNNSNKLLSNLSSNIETIRIRWESTGNEESVLRSSVNLVDEPVDDDVDVDGTNNDVDVDEEEGGGGGGRERRSNSK